jgi:archaemetzincin
MIKRFFAFLCFVFLLVSCQQDKKLGVQKPKEQIVLQIQPFEDVSDSDVKIISEKIKAVYPYVEILEKISIPKTSYVKERNRFRADTIIKVLANSTKNGFVKVGLTNKDISVTKGHVKDFGVMGLGYRPGKSCVASSFRINKNKKQEQWFKVAIHEIGHTQGLPHCPNKSCWMRDAEGKNYTDELVDFCDQCKTFLKTKNWKFS